MDRAGQVACRELSDLGSLTDAWDDLVLGSDLPSPFLRRWWLGATTSPRRRFVLVLDGDDLIGGVALDHDRVLGIKRYRFASQGTLCPDHLDLLARPDRRDDVVAAFRSWWSGATRILDLDGLVASSLLARCTDTVSSPTDVAPYAALPGSGDAWMSQRSSSFRRSVRRSTNRLAASGLHPRRVDAGGLEQAIDSFVDLHSTRDGREALVARTDTLRHALEDAVPSGEAWVHVLGSDDACAAVSVAFVVGGRLSCYQLARSTAAEHDGAGTALLAHVICEAADAGLQEVDLLRGGEDYKSSLVTSSREVHRLRVGHGLRARAVVAGTDRAVALARGLRTRVNSRVRAAAAGRRAS